MNLKDSQRKSRFCFPVTFTTDEIDGGFTVTFRDLPEAITQGEYTEDALFEAVDCLEEAMRPCVLKDTASHIGRRKTQDKGLARMYAHQDSDRK